MEQKIKIDPFIAQKEIVRRSPLYLIVKRFFDIIASLLLLILLLPLLLFIALAIFLLEGNPILFKQERVGKDAQPFIIWKFRTMKNNDLSNFQPSRTWVNGVPDDFVFKTRMSMHVTKIGKWLRKFSIDEIPQLINVLKGDMSLIGPRPEVPEIVTYYNEYQMKRLYVKPGITGYAQVNGRSNINHGQKIYYDLYYVNNYSFHLDVKIIFLTILKVLKTDGAV